MKRKHHKLKYKMMANPDKKYKDLKQKQKAKIADWMYKETFRFYKENNRLPYDNEITELLNVIYEKIKSAAIWIPFDEVLKSYTQKLPHYEDRIKNDMANEAIIPSKKPIKNAMPKPKKKRKKSTKKKKEFYPNIDDTMDDTFAFIADYTSGDAAYGLTWEDVGIPSELPFEVKKKLYLEDIGINDIFDDQ